MTDGPDQSTQLGQSTTHLLEYRRFLLIGQGCHGLRHGGEMGAAPAPDSYTPPCTVWAGPRDLSRSQTPLRAAPMRELPPMRETNCLHSTAQCSAMAMAEPSDDQGTGRAGEASTSGRNVLASMVGGAVAGVASRFFICEPPRGA